MKHFLANYLTVLLTVNPVGTGPGPRTTWSWRITETEKVALKYDGATCRNSSSLLISVDRCLWMWVFYLN